VSLSLSIVKEAYIFLRALYTHARDKKIFKFCIKHKCTIIVAVTEGLVREEQLLHDMCLLGAVTVEITQILTRARN
jgi:hypothetical protein